MRIGIFTDVHANLPALDAILTAMSDAGCERIFHTGDALAVGPHPQEVITLITETASLTCISGNNDEQCSGIEPPIRDSSMTDDEYLHYRWTWSQLTPQLRSCVAGWPRKLTEEIDGHLISFVHYASTEDGKTYQDLQMSPDASALDQLFRDVPGEAVFYGHDHKPRLECESRLYVNPGSSGCSQTAVARYALAEIHRTNPIEVSLHEVPYDGTPLIGAYESRQVPERDFLIPNFLPFLESGK